MVTAEDTCDGAIPVLVPLLTGAWQERCDRGDLPTQ
jgi:hypothetical protein